MASNESIFAPFSDILGTASTNVPAYSNTDDETFSVERHYMHGIFMGIKWQCVEYARRWLLLRKGCVFKNVRHAADIWSEISYVERVTDGQRFPLKAHPNGSPTLPKIDSFLIYSRSEEQPVGHIAVICEVGPDHIRIAEQNNKFHYWNETYARQIAVISKDGLYYIEDEDPVYGWMEIEDNNQLKPLDQLDLNTIHSEYQQSPSMGKLQRRTLPRKSINTKISWLNQDDPAEKYFFEHYDEQLQRINDCPDYFPYYKINTDFLLTIAEVSKELHRMFLEATGRVIQDDELLINFGIPNIFWNRIRQSWINDQNLLVTGRLDFAFDEKQLKLFEYNADISTALFQCAIAQKRWGEAIELPSSFVPSRRLHNALINTWKKMQITTKIHILIENNQDQILTALYIQNVIKEANIQSKLCINTNDLYWKDGYIIDNDGETVKLVWKLWTWDRVFQDYINVTNGRQLNNGDNITKDLNSQHPQISDILLHDQIKVIEPLWKVITSNKALLSVLWHMYPNHPNLLRTELNLTDELKQISFVKKPTVGHDGNNIILYGPGGNSIIASTTGNFSDRNSIYQELFPLKNSDGYYTIINSWIIRGNFAGFCVREDQNSITNNQSIMTPACVIWEEEK